MSQRVPDNPFRTGGEWKGHQLEAVDAQSRLDMVQRFTLEQCREALWLQGHEHLALQKSVIEALHRRVRELVGRERR